MKCVNCGSDNPNNSSFCTNCGVTLSNPNKNNNTSVGFILGIISIVSLFIFPIITIPLSIIGFILSITNKEQSNRTAGIVLNTVSFLICLVFVLFVFSALNLVFHGFRDFDINTLFRYLNITDINEEMIGTWDCTSFGNRGNDEYILTYELYKDGTFKWYKYDDEINNHVYGKYDMSEVEKDETTLTNRFVKLHLKSTEFIENNKDSGPYESTYEVAIDTDKKEQVLINEKTYNMYFCKLRQ